jgi:hypothetical protein
MKIKFKSGLMLCFGILGLISCEKNPPPKTEENKLIKYAPMDVVKNNRMNVYVHYMSWFEDKNSSQNGNWGSHWTMSTRNPDIIDTNGNREIASHFYPLIGPYASGNPDVIEYHLLLMKYSGVEGILIDWYGSSNVYDYKGIRENSEKLIDKISEAGLKFAIVYEDRTIPAVTQNTGTDRIEAAKYDMIYIQDNYFNNPSYIYIDNKPLFMVFGPEEFHTPEEWTKIMSAFNELPLFLILNGKSSETNPNSSGEYIWVDNSSLDSKYNTKNNFQYFMGGTYPGFKDYYKEGGWGDGLGWNIDYKNGETFATNLQKAKNYHVDYLQLITWNDFGEGTMIEPTKEFGSKMLETLQTFAGVSYSHTELDAIYMLFKLRQEKIEDAGYQTLLDQCFYYFVSLQNEKAINLIDSLQLELNR